MWWSHTLGVHGGIFLQQHTRILRQGLSSQPRNMLIVLYPYGEYLRASESNVITHVSIMKKVIFVVELSRMTLERDFELGWSEYYRNCWSTGIFTRNHRWGFQRTLSKRENIQWAAVLWMRRPRWCERWEETGLTDDRKATVARPSTGYNQGMQNNISKP